MSQRDEQEISQIVEAGFEAILSGTSSLEDVLRQHPDLAAAIRPELEAALWLVSQRKQVSPRPGYVSASRRRVVERIRQESAAQGTKHALLGIAWPRRFAAQAAMALGVILLLVLGGTGFFHFASTSLPGDTLYTAKRTQEQVVYRLAFSEERQITLRLEYAERRLDEAEGLVKAGNNVAAQHALEEYRGDVHEAAVLITSIDSGRAQQKKTLAVAMQNTLQQQEDRLQVLAFNVPELSNTIQQASAALMLSNAAAAQAEQEAVEELATASQTPSSTDPDTATSTDTQAATQTQSAVETETATDPSTGEPAIIITDTVTGEPIVIDTPVPATDTQAPVIDTPTSPQDSPTPREKKTPKPTNENRPDKTVEPTTSGSTINDKAPPGQEKTKDTGNNK